MLDGSRAMFCNNRRSSGEQELIGTVNCRNLDAFNAMPLVTDGPEGQTDFVRSTPMLDIARSIDARSPVR